MLTSLLSPEIKSGLQEFIKAELYAQNLYRSLANQMQRAGYFGAQKFFIKESGHEAEHYQRIVDFMNDMQDVASIPMIEEITDVASSIGTALRISYEIELDLMRQYKDFYKKAEDADCVVAEFLLKFLKIQRESVGEFGDLISRYDRCGINEGAILEFDKYLGEL